MNKERVRIGFGVKDLKEYIRGVEFWRMGLSKEGREGETFFKIGRWIVVWVGTEGDGNRGRGYVVKVVSPTLMGQLRDCLEWNGYDDDDGGWWWYGRDFCPLRRRGEVTPPFLPINIYIYWQKTKMISGGGLPPSLETVITSRSCMAPTPQKYTITPPPHWKMDMLVTSK